MLMLYFFDSMQLQERLKTVQEERDSFEQRMKVHEHARNLFGGGGGEKKHRDFLPPEGLIPSPLQFLKCTQKIVLKY